MEVVRIEKDVVVVVVLDDVMEEISGIRSEKKRGKNLFENKLPELKSLSIVYPADIFPPFFKLFSFIFHLSSHLIAPPCMAGDCDFPCKSVNKLSTFPHIQCSAAYHYHTI